MLLTPNIRTTALFTVLHLLVDGLCACSIFMLQPSLGGIMVTLLFVGYNVLAFMTQPLVGLWMDRVSGVVGTGSYDPELGQGDLSLSPLRLSLRLRLSMLLLFSGALLTAVYPHIVASVSEVNSVAEMALVTLIVVLLGMGNSIFHIIGGKTVTETTGNDPRHLGLFVSSGALGLALGGAFHSLTLMVVMILVITSLIPLTPKTRGTECSSTEGVSVEEVTVPPVLAGASVSSSRAWGVRGVRFGLILFLLLLVFVRSLVGNIKPEGVSELAHFSAIASVLAFVGKASGGFVAQRYGVWATLTVAFLLSGVCLLLSGTHWVFAIAMVLLVNLTMPLTLHLANRSLPLQAGLAFGALAFILIPGYALGMFLSGNSMAYLLLCTLVATIVIEAVVLLVLRERRWQVLAMSVVMNILTNLPLNLAVCFVPMLQRPSLFTQLGLEGVVVAIEFLLFYAVTRRQRTALLYAVLCNATSYFCGLLFSYFYY